MSQRFQFSLKTMLLATSLVALWAWIVSLTWTSPHLETSVKLVVPPMLCLALLTLWSLLRT